MSNAKRGRSRSTMKNPVSLHGFTVEGADKIALVRIANQWGTSTSELVRLGVKLIIRRMDKLYSEEQSTKNNSTDES